MLADLSNWRKDWSLTASLFGHDAARLRARLGTLRPRHVVFCSFENRFAKSGGLAAVAVNTLPFLKETNQLESVCLMTPFYPFIMDVQRLEHTGIRFEVPYADGLVDAELLQYSCSYSAPRSGGLPEYYLKADGFFGARSRLGDPYLYVEDNPAENEQRLRESALFFSAAVPAALAALGLKEDVVLHLQEWQTTLVAFTAKEAMLEGLLTSCGTVQTLHNPYDCFVPKRDLKQVVTSRARRDRIDTLPGVGLTAFQVGLQLVDAPVATVSENFARELTSDIMQTDHFAPHLQQVLRNGVVGINNGPFVGFSDKFPKRARHTVQEILEIKRGARHALLQVLDTYTPPERFGELTYGGGVVLGLPDDVPIVVMSGRLDPMQKGYDILLQALEGFEPDEIKAVLTPMAMRDSDLAPFRVAADRCRGNLVVFPMRMRQGYLELQTGSTFGVMPSIYEPFGAAVEYMVNGTVNIARRTGGLVDQVVHGENGFLFREPPDFYTAASVRSFADSSGAVQTRRNNRWATDMATTLWLTLKGAAALYRGRRDDYHRMILRGFERAAEFSWETNAAEYWRVYQTIAEASSETAVV